MDPASLLTEWYTRWTILTLSEHLTNIIGGLIGAVIFCAWTMPVIRLPEFDPKRNELRLNSVGMVVVGVFIAWLVDTHFVLSLLGGFLGPKLAEVTVNTVLPGVGRALVRYADTKAVVEGGGDSNAASSSSASQQEYGYYGGGYAAYNRAPEVESGADSELPAQASGYAASGELPASPNDTPGVPSEPPAQAGEESGSVWERAEPER